MKSSITLVAFLLLFPFTYAVHAQTSPATLVKEWERAKAYTKAYLDAMPDTAYGFKPTADMRSFAQQMLHLTDANYGLGALALGTKSPFKLGDVEKSTDQSKANVTKLVLAGYDFVIDGVKNMTAAQLSEKIKLFDKFDVTREGALWKVFEHQTHHRGQTTVYLRLEHVTPPQEMLF